MNARLDPRMVAVYIQTPLEVQGSVEDADRIAASSHGGLTVTVIGGIPWLLLISC